MDDKDLEILSDLARTNNISKTAQRLYTTQSAVTKRLQKLEAELGRPLFLRSKKGLLPEPVLAAILPEVTGAADAIARIRAAAAAADGDLAGTLRLGVALNYARYRLPEVLADYRARYPRVDVYIRANRSINVFGDLSSGEIDLAIVRGGFAWRGGDILLAQDRHCLVLPPGRTEADRQTLPFIGRDNDAAYRADLARWFAEQDLAPSRAELTVNDVTTIIAMVEHGIGWSVLPGISLAQFRGVKKPLSFRDGTPFVHRTHILYRQDQLRLPQFRAFVDLALAHEREHSPEPDAVSSVQQEY